MERDRDKYANAQLLSLSLIRHSSDFAFMPLRRGNIQCIVRGENRALSTHVALARITRGRFVVVGLSFSCFCFERVEFRHCIASRWPLISTALLQSGQGLGLLWRGIGSTVCLVTSPSYSKTGASIRSYLVGSKELICTMFYRDHG